MNGIVISIIEADTAPEISPKVSTVFFMEFQSPFLRNVLSPARYVAGDARGVAILSGDSALRSEKSCFRVGRTRHGISRAALPSCTACVRRFAPSLSKIRLEWVFTVFS